LSSLNGLGRAHFRERRRKVREIEADREVTTLPEQVNAEPSEQIGRYLFGLSNIKMNWPLRSHLARRIEAMFDGTSSGG
jgi:hypothetical protein